MNRRKTKRILGFPDLFWIGFVIMVGFFLKLVYDIQAGWTITSHNLGVWVEEGWQPGGGVLGVIQYYYNMHRFPDIDPRTLVGYAGPPLYYMFAACLMGLFHGLMGWSVSISIHLVQAMNVIFVEVAMGCGIGILQKFGVKGRKLVTSILFLTFFPALYNLSASLTADALCFMMSMLCLNSALSWYETRQKRKIMITAALLGIGLMCGYRVILVLPAILSLFISAREDGRTNASILKNQYTTFFVEAGLLGILWPVRQLIRFGLSPFYMHPEQETWRNLEGIEWLTRLSLPTNSQLTSVHMTGSTAEISNIWAQLVKTSVFDENALTLDLTGTRKLAVALLYVVIASCLISHIMLVWTLVVNRRNKAFFRFELWGYTGMFLPFILFCLLQPTAGAVNFRFFPEIMIFPLLGMAMCGDRTEDDNLFERTTSVVAAYLIFMMAVMTAFLFGFYH